MTSTLCAAFTVIVSNGVDAAYDKNESLSSSLGLAGSLSAIA